MRNGGARRRASCACRERVHCLCGWGRSSGIVWHMRARGVLGRWLSCGRVQVAEAKARKKRRVSQKLAVARGKAEAIVDVEDMSVQAKAREIGKLYSKAKAAGRDRRAAAAGKSDNKLSRSARATKARKGPPLDRRMIADKMKGAAKAKNTGRSKGKKGRR